MSDLVVFEKSDVLYIVAPVAPLANIDGEEVAFADEIRKMAPSDHMGWLRGQYVEAERPNANGQAWGTDTLEIASLTPRLMPVTIMHDLNTAVGMIADTKLLTVEADKVPRARIDTTLGIWKHRFPHVWEEIGANYERGSLMQSMECRPAYYDCMACGQRFPKLPGNAEAANWCSHLRAEEVSAGITKAARRLGNVTFTGSGLIYGSRGIRGAMDTAHLEVFQDEVAAFHEKVKRDSSREPAKPRRKRTMEIDDKRYEELVAAEQTAKALTPRVADLEETAAKVPGLESKVDALEIEKKTAVDELAAAKLVTEGLEETARAATLGTERTAKLGGAFLAKLPESVKTRLVDEQAKTLKDEDWTARLDELAALTGVKHDEAPDAAAVAAAAAAGRTFTADEIASQGGSGAANGNGGGGSEPTPQKRRSVIGGLAKTAAKSR